MDAHVFKCTREPGLNIRAVGQSVTQTECSTARKQEKTREKSKVNNRKVQEKREERVREKVGGIRSRVQLSRGGSDIK